MATLPKLIDLIKTLTDKQQRLVYKEQRELGISVIGIGGKPSDCYVAYINRGLADGIQIFHLLARGYAYILTAHQVVDAVLSSGQVNVFRCDFDEDEWAGERVPVAVITVVSAAKLAGTSQHVWSADRSVRWEQLTAKHWQSMGPAVGG